MNKTIQALIPFSSDRLKKYLKECVFTDWVSADDVFKTLLKHCRYRKELIKAREDLHFNCEYERKCNAGVQESLHWYDL